MHPMHPCWISTGSTGERSAFDLRMRGRSTGIELPLVVHQKLYMNHGEALQAVGLPE